MARKKSEEKRAAILEAALGEFLANGIRAARIEDIARAAGVAKGTVYLYFPSKDALFAALVDELAAYVTARMSEARARSEGPRERFAFVFDEILAGGCESRMARVIRLVWAEGLHSPEVVRPFARRFIIPAWSEGGHARSLAEDPGMPGEILRYPQLLVAPMVMGLLWQNIVGESMPLDLRGMYRAYLGMLARAADNAPR